MATSTFGSFNFDGFSRPNAPMTQPMPFFKLVSVNQSVSAKAITTSKIQAPAVPIKRRIAPQMAPPTKPPLPLEPSADTTMKK